MVTERLHMTLLGGGRGGCAATSGSFWSKVAHPLGFPRRFPFAARGNFEAVTVEHSIGAMLDGVGHVARDPPDGPRAASFTLLGANGAMHPHIMAALGRQVRGLPRHMDQTRPAPDAGTVGAKRVSRGLTMRGSFDDLAISQRADRSAPSQTAGADAFPTAAIAKMDRKIKASQVINHMDDCGIAVLSPDKLMDMHTLIDMYTMHKDRMGDPPLEFECTSDQLSARQPLGLHALRRLRGVGTLHQGVSHRSGPCSGSIVIE